MATVTKTFTENYFDVIRSTWTVSVTGTNQTIGSSSTFRIPDPVVKAKYVGSNKGYAGASIDIYDNNQTSNHYRGQPEYSLVSWASGAEYTLSVGSSQASVDRNVSSFFNANNKTSLTYDYVVKSMAYGIDLISGKTSDPYASEGWNSYENTSEYTWGTILTLTLDAPPIISATNTSSTNSKGYYWKGISSASVTISNTWAKYGGDIASATLTIGEQSVTASSGKLSIKVDTAGTFTPVLTATDTRGQTTTKNLTDITVQEYQSPTANWGTITSDTNGFYANVSTASLTISDISIMSGFTFEDATLTIGNQTQTITELDNNSVSFEIPLNAVGTFSPQVKINTSAGVWSSHNYNSITVGEYTQPNVSFQTYRAKNEPDTNPTKFGIKDEEGEEVLIEATFNYLSDICNLVEPSVIITDENGDTYSAVITWYTTYSETNGVSSAVNWTNYNPASPVTLYGLATGYGSTTGFSDGDAFQITITPEDSFGPGNAITNVVSSSYFTIDFQAGGKEICFGGPANDDISISHPKGLFKCKMDTEFNDMTNQEVSDFVDELDISGAGINLTQADWIVEQGTDGIWTWRKWESGIAECWGTYTQTITSGGAVLGGNYYSSNAIPYPTGFFVQEPNAQYAGRIDGGYCLTGTLYNASKDSIQMWCISQVSGSQSCIFHISAKGRWK